MSDRKEFAGLLPDGYHLPATTDKVRPNSLASYANPSSIQKALRDKAAEIKRPVSDVLSANARDYGSSGTRLWNGGLLRLPSQAGVERARLDSAPSPLKDYSNASVARRALRRHEAVHSILQQRRGAISDSIAGFAKEEATAYHKQFFGPKAPDAAMPFATKVRKFISGTYESTKKGIKKHGLKKLFESHFKKEFSRSHVYVCPQCGFEESFHTMQGRILHCPMDGTTMYPKMEFSQKEFAVAKFRISKGDIKWKSQAATMTPSQFLSKALPFGSMKSAEAIDKYRSMIQSGEKMQAPQLWVTRRISGNNHPANFAVTRHEGRHRAAAAQAEGVTHMPVEIISYGEPRFPDRSKSLKKSLKMAKHFRPESTKLTANLKSMKSFDYYPEDAHAERREFLKTGILGAGLATGIAGAAYALRGNVGKAERANIIRNAVNRVVGAQKNAKAEKAIEAAKTAKDTAIFAKTAAKERYKAGNENFKLAIANPNLTKGEKNAFKRTHAIWKAANPDKEFDTVIREKRDGLSKARDGALLAGGLGVLGAAGYAGFRAHGLANLIKGEIPKVSKAIRRHVPVVSKKASDVLDASKAAASQLQTTAKEANESVNHSTAIYSDLGKLYKQAKGGAYNILHPKTLLKETIAGYKAGIRGEKEFPTAPRPKWALSANLQTALKEFAEKKEPSLASKIGRGVLVTGAAVTGSALGGRTLPHFIGRGRPMREGESLLGKVVYNYQGKTTPAEVIHLPGGRSVQSVLHKAARRDDLTGKAARGALKVDDFMGVPQRHYAVGVGSGRVAEVSKTHGKRVIEQEKLGKIMVDHEGSVLKDPHELRPNAEKSVNISSSGAEGLNDRYEKAQGDPNFKRANINPASNRNCESYARGIAGQGFHSRQISALYGGVAAGGILAGTGAALATRKKDLARRIGDMKAFGLRTDDSGVPYNGRVAHDRFIKQIHEGDLERRDRNISHAAVAGGLAGGLTPSKSSLLRKVGVGGALGAASVLGIRAVTNNSRDIYGDRPRWAKTAEGIPAAAGTLAVAGLAAKKAKLFMVGALATPGVGKPVNSTHHLFDKPFEGYNAKRNAKTGGLNDKFRAKYNREHGSHLQRPVTKKPSELKAGSKAANRRASFCARMKGCKGPTSKDGKLTPKGAALKRWNCESKTTASHEFFNPYVGAALSGGLTTGGAAMAIDALRNKSTLAGVAKAGLGFGALGAGVAGGGTYVGSKILGSSQPEEKNPFAKRAAIGGAILGAGAGIAAGVASKKIPGVSSFIADHAKDVVDETGKVVKSGWRPAGWIQKASLPGAAAIGGGAGAAIGAHEGFDEGLGVDALNSSTMQNQNKKSLGRAIKGALKEFGYGDQSRQSDGRFRNPILGAYGLDENAGSVSPRQIATAFYNKGKAVHRTASRGHGLISDAKSVISGQPRERDLAGRPKKREWEKSWFKTGVGAAATGAALLTGAHVTRNTDWGRRVIQPKLRAAQNWAQSKGFTLLSTKYSKVNLFDDWANYNGWDIRDPRGKSARVFAPGSRARIRREKEWHEKKDNRDRLIAAVALAGAGAVGLGAAALTRHASGLPVIPQAVKDIAGATKNEVTGKLVMLPKQKSGFGWKGKSYGFHPNDAA
jgi:hypothetical protein